jgi:hypothetical protein
MECARGPRDGVTFVRQFTNPEAVGTAEWPRSGLRSDRGIEPDGGPDTRSIPPPRVLGGADPADKAEICTQLGLQLV